MLRRLKYGDENFLFKLMNLDEDNLKYSLPSSLEKWKKTVDWSIKDGDNDLYWIITYKGEDCGYIGFSDAKNKPSIKQINPENSLFLEIYLYKEFRGLGIAYNAYKEARSKIKDKKIYASTYNTNLKAQRFFADTLGMNLSHYYKNISTVYVDEV